MHVGAGDREGTGMEATTAGDEDMSLLLLDDDAPFRQRLARAMEKRGFDP